MNIYPLPLLAQSLHATQRTFLAEEKIKDIFKTRLYVFMIYLRHVHIINEDK